MEKTHKERPARPDPLEHQEPDDLILAEEAGTGEIKVSHDVVASIVRIAALEVQGVIHVGGAGGFREEIVGIFNKREASGGITVTENARKDYEISVKVILRFGVELAKVGEEIQIAVREQVGKMTNKKVARIDVLIDGVRMPERDEDDGDND